MIKVQVCALAVCYNPLRFLIDWVQHWVALPPNSYKKKASPWEVRQAGVCDSRLIFFPPETREPRLSWWTECGVAPPFPSPTPSHTHTEHRLVFTVHSHPPPLPPFSPWLFSLSFLSLLHARHWHTVWHSLRTFSLTANIIQHPAAGAQEEDQQKKITED